MPRRTSRSNFPQPYRNLHGDSGIVAYEIGDDAVTVKFADGWLYTYDYQSTGADNVEQMKQLATQGRGLNTFISTRVKSAYSLKFR